MYAGDRKVLVLSNIIPFTFHHVLLNMAHTTFFIVSRAIMLWSDGYFLVNTFELQDLYHNLRSFMIVQY